MKLENMQQKLGEGESLQNENYTPHIHINKWRHEKQLTSWQLLVTSFITPQVIAANYSVTKVLNWAEVSRVEFRCGANVWLQQSW